MCPEKYSKHSLELELLVPNAPDYIRTIKELKSSLDKCKNENAQQILTNTTIMVARGQQLSEELGRIEDTCDLALALCWAKLCICEYVESRVPFITPNLSLILGASMAAKKGVAGGLTLLSKLQHPPAGSFSSTSVLPHTSFIHHSNIAQARPLDMRRKEAELMAAKCMLAASRDSCHESRAGTGYKLREGTECKLDKWQEPAPLKPLPALLDGLRERGRANKWRKLKERLGLREEANRMSFGEVEEDIYQEELGFSLGHLGKASGGHLRQTLVNKATKARIRKALQRTLQKQSVIHRGKSTIQDHSSGMALSMAFTPLQELEIVNLQADRKKVAEANQKYFSCMATFVKVKGNKNGIPKSPGIPPQCHFAKFLEILEFVVGASWGD
ncbi:LOW QUALITY PROTEIN: U4/U6 small nuclear ribonucleoprotein Prp31 [Ammospiza maritima maritima]